MQAKIGLLAIWIMRALCFNRSFLRSSGRMTALRSLCAPAGSPSLKSQFLKEFSERGYLNQCTDLETLDDKLHNATSPVVAYLGFDATASSLHVGSLLQIMVLRAFQRAGHKPIVLIGGGTTRIGDPSGKDEARKILSEETIESNVKNISKIFTKFLTFGDGPTDAVIVDNADWLNSINYLNFLQHYGRHFTINRMLTFDSVKTRLEREQPLTFLEFNYMILQAYDFFEMSKRFGVSLQFGGSDQWGNIVNGVELARKVDQRHLIGLTSPLVTTSDGKKMGKSVSGAIWLDGELLSPFEYWQYWRNTADQDVIRFLKLFTEIPLDKIREYEKMEGADLNAVKAILADEATRLLHGEDCLQSIRQTAATLFSMSSSSSSQNLDSLKSYVVETESLSNGGVSLIDLMVMAELAASKNAARRLIANGGVRLNDRKVQTDQLIVNKNDFEELDGKIKLSVGKKHHVTFSVQQ